MIKRLISLSVKAFASVVLTLLLLFSQVFAASDPDPNSPTPVLLSQTSSDRALTSLPDPAGRTFRQTSSDAAFKPGQKIKLYVANVVLMHGEGANAFRVFARDAKGRLFRFPVMDLNPVKGREWIIELTVRLANDLLDGRQPTADGDIQVSVAWRGLSSNQVRLGLGKTGGELQDDREAKPTPLASFAARPEPVYAADYVEYRFSGDRLRFLEQATFGPTAALDQRIRRLGLRQWLAGQFDAPYPDVDNPYPDLPLKSSDPDNIAAGCGMYPEGSAKRAVCKRDHYTMYPVQNWFFRQAFYGEAQLRHRVAWALNQLWVISGIGTQQSSHMVEYHKILSRNAFGNYRDLMHEMTLNPGMGNYLDMARSTRDNPNENFAREILQLFSVGLFMLNQDGTLQLDKNGNPIPTYSQQTVNNFTKVFTGWDFCNNGNRPECPNARVGTVNYKDPLIMDEARHDQTAKTLLSYPNAVYENIPPGQTGEMDLDQALDNIFYHPNLPPFVSRYLIQQLVLSDPTPAYVGRVAAVFADNGSGVRGDLKAVVRAVLLDPEARGDRKDAPTYGKLREPVLFVTNIARQFDVRSADGSTRSDGVVHGITETIGQSVFYAPSVFNYYPPDYTIAGTALNAPEFGIMNTEIAINRYNQVNLLVFEYIPGGTPNTPFGTSIDLREMERLSSEDPSGALLVEALNQRMLHGTMESGLRDSIRTAVQAVSPDDHAARARNAVYLTASSAQYQIQR